MKRILESGAGKELKAEIRRLTKQYIADGLRAYDESFHRSREHDTLIDICASAFGPQSSAYQDLGFLFLTAEPLVEKQVKSFDLLIYNDRLRYGILVECKSSISAPATVVTGVLESRDQFLANQKDLEESLGIKFDLLDFVLCVPAEMIDRVARELERRETATPAPSRSDFIRLWQVNKFAGQTLQLFTRINGRPTAADNQHRDRKLTKLLADGIKVNDAEVLFKAYPSSHPLTVATNALTHIIDQSRVAGRPLNEIPDADLRGFLQSAERVPHYAQPTIGTNLADRLVREGQEFGILQALEGAPQRWKLAVDGKTMRTLIANLQRAHREAGADRIAERRATREVLEAFRKKQPSLAEFEGKPAP